MVFVHPFTTVASPSGLTVAVPQASVAVGAVNDGVAVHSIVALPPCPPIVGGVVSTTVIVCDTVELWLPQASTASHVLVIVFVHPLTTVASPSGLTVAVPQASVAVGAVNDGVAVHWIVALPPCPPIVGGVVSTTVIVCDTVELWLPQASTASQVLVMVFVHPLTTVASPSGLMVAVPHASVAVGAVNDGVAVHWIVALPPCPPIVGGVVSTTVIVCDTVEL